jgi:prepilin-type N-terminal cleavage/methylation domain-containing protein
MRTSSVGRTEAGVTLIEMLVVVALIAIMAGVSFPAFTSGIDSLRLNQATASVANFLNTGLNRAERRQQAVEILISRAQNYLEMRSAEPGFYRRLDLPDGISITHILPEAADVAEVSRSFLLYPGGSVPRLGVELINRRNIAKIVRVDPITSVPQVEQPEP